MLVLTRKSNESVVINNNIEIKILNVRSDQVSIGFAAPREVSIYRKEVHEAIQQENIHAAARSASAISKIRSSLGEHLEKSRQMH